MKYNKNKKELFEMMMDLEIENLNKALGLIDDIEAVIAGYDGKVINKNLENRLRKIDDNIRIEKQNYFNYYVIYVKINFYNNRDIEFEGRNFYSELTELDLNKYSRSDEITSDGKRLNAEEFLKKFEGTKEMIKNMIKSREEAKRDFEETLKAHQEMQEKIEKFNKELNTNIDQYFSLMIRSY